MHDTPKIDGVEQIDERHNTRGNEDESEREEEKDSLVGEMEH